MTTLGCDQSINATGLCVVTDGKPVAYMTITTSPGEFDGDRMMWIAQQVVLQVRAHNADLVVLEEPYIPKWLRGRELNRKAQEALVLRELGGRIEVEARLAGAEVKWLEPSTGFAALTGRGKGDKLVHVNMANALLRTYGLATLKDSEHHIADALGLALAGERRATAGVEEVPA
jgi:Holliday junction resolvasome RuvABC endonuclease subunit